MFKYIYKQVLSLGNGSFEYITEERFNKFGFDIFKDQNTKDYDVAFSKIKIILKKFEDNYGRRNKTTSSID